jgi:hypothetical protein
MVKSKMIGVVLVLGALGLLVLVIFLDVLFAISQSWDIGELRRLITESADYNLLLYELPFIILMIGVPFLIEETQNRLLLDMFPTIWIQVGVWIPIILLVAFLNTVRFERRGLDRRNEKLSYSIAEEIAEKGRTPDEGLEEGLAYIRSRKNKLRVVSERGFLQHLTTRGDRISEIAAKRLDEL